MTFPTAEHRKRIDMRLPVTERVSEMDRLWFEKHPEATFYDRPYVPGEFGVETDEQMAAIGFTRVHQIEPGVRTRCAVAPTDQVVGREGRAV